MNAAEGSLGFGPDGGLERRLLLLMGARLALSAVSLGLAVALEAAGWPYSPAEWRGFYGTVIFAFVATILYGLILGRVVNVRRFAAVNVATDIAIVSALVYMSGGSDSPFTFLYVVVAVYGAVLFERRGALLCAIASAVVYGSVLLAELEGIEATPAISSREPARAVVGMWFIHAGAVVLVAALGSLLSAELRRTGAALEQRTTDLTRLETLHQRTVESLVSGLLTTDSAGLVTSFNPEAERITGVPVADAIGTPIEEIVPGIRELLGAATPVAEGHRSRARIPHRDGQGRQRHLGVGAYVLKSADDGTDGHVVIFQDVTDVVEMESSLRRSERLAAIGELSASIAHEIRNPLAAISGSIEMLHARASGARNSDDLESVEQEGESDQLMQIVLREVERLDHLISDFLHFARPGPRVVAPVRVEHAVGELLEMFDASRPEGVEVHLDVDERAVVAADPGQLDQVLWNLVLNAVQAMPDGGGLRLSAGPPNAGPSQEGPGEDRRAEDDAQKAYWVEITVADDGTGIEPEVLERIFDPFFTMRPGGSGLGLATVARIVDDHGGVVRVTSEVGTGTAVTVRLPAAEAEASA